LLRKNSEVSQEELHKLIAIAEARVTPELGDLKYAGRTIYTDEYRIKGAYGLKSLGGVSFTLENPQPLIEYGKAVPHITLSPEMDIGIRYSRPRALYSLSAKGAVTEYECMLRMHKAGFALMPCLAAEFNLSEGNPERILPGMNNQEGEPTGVFIQRALPDLKFLGQVISFHLVGDDLFSKGAEKIFVGYPEFDILEPTAMIDLIHRYCDFVERIGEIRRASIGSGVLRHVAHFGNFLYSPAIDKLFMSDTDSCLVVGLDSELNDRTAGPQLVRDLCNDIVRVYATLARDAYSSQFLEIYSGDYVAERDPAYRFLKGVVGDRLSEDRLVELCKFFHEMALSHFEKSSMLLKHFSQARADSFLREDVATQRKMESLWSYCAEELRKYALFVAFSVVQDLKLDGYVVKEPSSGDLINKFTAGVDLYLKELAATLLPKK